MWLGIMLGLFLGSLLANLAANPKGTDDKTTLIAMACVKSFTLILMLVGLFGAAGWIIEMLF